MNKVNIFVKYVKKQGHNVVEDTLCIECGMARNEGNEAFFVTIQVDRLKVEG